MNINTLNELKDCLLVIHGLGVKLSFSTFSRWNVQNIIDKINGDLNSITSEVEIVKRWNASQSNTVKDLFRSYGIDIYAICQNLFQVEEMISKTRLHLHHIKQIKQQNKYFLFGNSSPMKIHVEELTKLRDGIVVKLEQVRTYAGKLVKLEREIGRGLHVTNIHNEKFINTTEKKKPDIYVSFEKGTAERMLYDAIFNPHRSNRDIFVVGPGGTGKTATVSSICSRTEIESIYPGGVFFCKLKPGSNSYQIMKILSHFLKLRGNHLNADQVMRTESMEDAVMLASSSFGKRPCLFIFDDICFDDDLDVDILRVLSSLAHVPGSKIVYTTRDGDVNWGEHIVFRARSKSNLKRILLGTSGLDDPKESSFQSILNDIIGQYVIPMELSMCGRLLHEISRSLHENERNLTWLRYGAMYNTQQNDSLSRLERILEQAIEFLKNTVNEKYDEYFTLLSVLEPFHRIPAVALFRLWRVPEEQGKEILEGFKRLSILEEEVDVTSPDCPPQQLTCHDYILKFARKMSGKRNIAQSIFKMWIYAYIFPYDMDVFREGKSDQGRTFSFSEICEHRSSSSIFNTYNFLDKKPNYKSNLTLEFMSRWHAVVDDGYIFKKAVRMLTNAFMFDEALWLAQEPKWIVQRMLKFGLFSALEDIDTAASFIRRTLYCNDDTIHLLDWLRFLKKVVSEVHADFEKDIPDTLLWTILYKRLMYYEDPFGRVQCFLRKIDAQSEKPWIKPQLLSHSSNSCPSRTNLGDAICRRNISIGHTAWVWALDSTTDGRTVVSGSTDRTVRVWVEEDGVWTNCLLGGHTSTVFSVCINDAGDVINSKDKDGNSFFWALDQQEWKRTKGQGFKNRFSVGNTRSLSREHEQDSSFSEVVSKLSGHLTVFIPSGFVTAVSCYPYIEFYKFAER